jgi:methionyl aminopeptidase
MSRADYTAKTNAEILLMRQAGLITRKALNAVRDAAKPGVSTIELDTIADKVIRDHGAHSNFQLVDGYVHTICSSINDEIVHGIPRADRVLAAGDILSIDCGAEVDGWNGDSAFSIVVPGLDNDVTKQRQLQSDVCEGSLWAGIAALAGAKRLNEVGVAIEHYIAQRGKWGILEQYVGHGIGRSMHEDPAVFNYQTRDLGPVVESGLVIAIEPMITGGKEQVKILSDEWTVSTKDGSDGAHWEHTVARHKDGIWVLTAEDGGLSGLAPYGVVPSPLNP